jgi:hypothetical protein
MSDDNNRDNSATYATLDHAINYARMAAFIVDDLAEPVRAYRPDMDTHFTLRQTRQTGRGKWMWHRPYGPKSAYI